MAIGENVFEDIEPGETIDVEESEIYVAEEVDPEADTLEWNQEEVIEEEKTKDE